MSKKPARQTTGATLIRLALKISGSMYLPAEETLSNVIGLNYNYNADTQTLNIENTVTNKKVKLVLNETTMTVNGAPVSLLKKF